MADRTPSHSDPAALPSAARLLVLGSGLWFLGAGVPSVLFELYLNSLGLLREQIGQLSLAHNIGGALLAPLAAALLDRLGQRNAILVGGVIGILGWAATLLTNSVPLMLVLFTISGFGLVLYAITVVPLAAALSTPANRTRLFSINEGVSTIAAVAGNLLAGVLPLGFALLLNGEARSPEAYRAAILVSLVLRGLALLPMARLHPPPIPPPASGEASAPHASAVRYFDPRYLLRLKTPAFRYALPLAIIFLGGGMIGRFLGLILRDRFGISDQVFSALMAAMNLAMGLATFAGPALARRIGRVESLITGSAFSVLAYAVFGFSTSLALVVLALVLRAALFNLALPLYRAHIMDRTPRAEYAVVNLILTTAINVGAISPPISGWLQDRFGLTPVFLTAITAYALGTLLLVAIARRDRTPQPADGTGSPVVT